MAKEEKARLFLGAEHQMAVFGNGHADNEVAEVDSGSDEEIVVDILLIFPLSLPTSTRVNSLARQRSISASRKNLEVNTNVANGAINEEPRTPPPVDTSNVNLRTSGIDIRGSMSHDNLRSQESNLHASLASMRPSLSQDNLHTEVIIPPPPLPLTSLRLRDRASSQSNSRSTSNTASREVSPRGDNSVINTTEETTHPDIDL